MDAIEPILHYVEQINFSQFPPAVVAKTKAFMLDAFATAVAGTRAPGCDEVRSQLREWGGKPEATVVGARLRLPAPHAALINGMMVHALDFDDTHEPADVHATAVVLPAAMAATELAGDVDGREFLVAVTIGIDVACRLGLAIRKYRGWHPTATCGIFGATLAAGRVLGLKGGALHHAAGIAYSLASGNFQCLVDGALTKRLQPGFASRAAVEAVLLARRGVTGAKNVLEGTFGFYPLYEAGEYDPRPLREGLATLFEVENLSMKPYPSCRFCHSAIDAVLELSTAEAFSPDDVESVRVEMPAEAYKYVGGPFRPGESPQVSAQFNTAYNVAVALVHKSVGLQHFERKALEDPRVRSLAERVDTKSNGDANGFGPVTVTVALRSGRVYTREVAIMKGHPDSPMAETERMQKVRQCLAYAGWPLERATALAEWVSSLERGRVDTSALHEMVG